MIIKTGALNLHRFGEAEFSLYVYRGWKIALAGLQIREKMRELAIIRSFSMNSKSCKMRLDEETNTDPYLYSIIAAFQIERSIEEDVKNLNRYHSAPQRDDEAGISSLAN